MLYLEYYQNKSQTTTAVQLYYQIDAGISRARYRCEFVFQNSFEGQHERLYYRLCRTYNRSFMHAYVCVRIAIVITGTPLCRPSTFYVEASLKILLLFLKLPEEIDF